MPHGWRQTYTLRTMACLLVFLAVIPADAQRPDPYRDARHKMVSEYIEREGVTNPLVLASMRQVHRHEFVTAQYRKSKDAYLDAALPIGYKQTISPPFVVAYMTQTIDPQPTDRVLEIGTGSGYQAAVLANIVKEVYSIEIVPELGKTAAERLARLKYTNVKTKVGDGYLGWEEYAPFDKIIVTCSPENVPQPLIDQLKEGGRLLVPLGERYQQVFHQFEKKDGKLEEKTLISTLFVPMTGQSEEQRRVKPDPLNPKILNSGFEDDDDGDGYPDHWHYQRLTKLVEQDAPQGKRCLLLESNDHQRISQALQATAIDGTKISSLQVRIQYKLENVVRGQEPFEAAAVVIHFYDENRKAFENAFIGPWEGTRDWDVISKTITVPQKAREMIVRIGLNGATGKLWVDDLSIVPKLR
ncbi:protein-L-isoaspartate(D-aspartate) O-methyltransferase [Schlesneria paludicola]|uniref:protein-L-isoaspartate(D-aspartate) O-methyltransferase n=1 Tax=Schlesneria paludicola TaxID=360056 RepID=UPI00029B08DD|nr:protein-L-isoaspartate(D-aspartate) O-methyltransferase [Schlesneria paludicola]